MRTILPALVLIASATAAAPAPDALTQQLVADARAIPAKGFGFERTAHVEGGGKTQVRIDRYDPAQPQPWTLISIDGRAPTADERREYAKTSATTPAPSYARVLPLLAVATKVDATHYHVARLPDGFVRPGALAKHLVADLTVDTSGARPFVRENRVYATEPFRLYLIAKIDKFDGVSRYAPGSDGKPRIVAQDIVFSGSRPGESGTVITRSTFTPLAH